MTILSIAVVPSVLGGRPSEQSPHGHVVAGRGSDTESSGSGTVSGRSASTVGAVLIGGAPLTTADRLEGCLGH